MEKIKLYVAVAILSLFFLVTCISISHKAEAATLEQITALMSAFSGMKLRSSERRIVFWDAKANQVAHCWKFTVPSNVATPPKGQGFYAHQWGMQETSAIVTEEQCYAQP